MAKLHAVSYKIVGLEKFGRTGGYYTRQMKTLKTISEAQAAVTNIKTREKVGEVPHFYQLLEWFTKNLPNDRSAIVHGDYKLDNMVFIQLSRVYLQVFHPTELKVIGLLDWELSTIGHPLSDLANLVQPLQLSIEASFVPPSPNGGFPHLHDVLRWYQAEAGWDPLPEFPFADAFCLWRTSIIAQGIAARYARGQASSSEAQSYGQKMFPLGELAWKTVEEYENSQSTKPKL